MDPHPNFKLEEEKYIIQQSSKQLQVARLGILALETKDLGVFMEEVVRTITRTLDMKYGIILEIQQGQRFRIAAEYGWILGEAAVIESTKDSLLGYTLHSKEPVVVKNLQNENRFSSSDFLFENDVVSGISVIIHRKNRPYGVLGVYCCEERSFNQDDINFIQSIAYILGSVINQYYFIEEIKRSEERYRELVESATNAIFISDKEGNYTIVNSKACQLLGYTKSELLSMNIRDLIPRDELSTNPPKLQELLSGKELVLQRNFLHKSGTKVPVEISAKMLPDGRLQGIVRDLTFQKKSEIEMMRTSKFQSIVHLAGGIAHDFNNLLSVILGNLTIIESAIDKENTIATEAIQNAILAVDRVTSLTKQLLTLSQEKPPSKRLHDLKGLIKDTIKISLQGSSVDIDITDDLWPAEIDESQIGQVIQNLIINADQATSGRGTIHVKAENIKKLELDGEMINEPYVVITVKDFGHGIPIENQDKIFDPFFTTKKKGTGLGLSTAYAIVKNHNGIIRLNSELGEGTTMKVYLPASVQSIEEIEDKKIMEKKEIHSGKILVLDDNEMLLVTVERILESAGYTIDTCTSGEEAIRMFSNSKYDLVMLDLTIPGGMGGLEVLERLLEIDRDVKCIVSSGYSTDMALENYAEYGFVGKIEKPYTRKELIDVITNVQWKDT